MVHNLFQGSTEYSLGSIKQGTPSCLSICLGLSREYWTHFVLVLTNGSIDSRDWFYVNNIMKIIPFT